MGTVSEFWMMIVQFGVLRYNMVLVCLNKFLVIIDKLIPVSILPNKKNFRRGNLFRKRKKTFLDVIFGTRMNPLLSSIIKVKIGSHHKGGPMMAHAEIYNNCYSSD